MNAPAKDLRVCLISIAEAHTSETNENESVCSTLIEQAGHRVTRRLLLTEHQNHLAEIISDLTSQNIFDVILFVGGTGLGPHGSTLDAIERTYERTVEGFAEGFRLALWSEFGPKAALVRASAGLLSGCTIFVLPDSPRLLDVALRKLVFPIAADALELAWGRSTYRTLFDRPAAERA